MASETVGQWLRSFSFGQLGQLDKVLELSIAAAWQYGAGPGSSDLTLDFDSTVRTVYGTKKQGASWSYNDEWSYHPLLATRADTGEMINARLRGGSANSARKAASFIRQSVKRARRCGATGKIIVRADSAFYQADVAQACAELGVHYSIGCKLTQPVLESIDAIPERAWRPLQYSGGSAHVAETTMHGAWKRLIVRRFTKRERTEQGKLFETYGYAAFVTDREGDIVELDKEIYGYDRYTDTLELDCDHRRRAVQELAIRDIVDGPLAHFPSGRFNANQAWLTLACIAHNAMRWLACLGLKRPGLIVARTIRFQLLAVPARITRSGRKTSVHMPKNWPWQHQWLHCVRRLRGLTIQPL